MRPILRTIALTCQELSVYFFTASVSTPCLCTWPFVFKTREKDREEWKKARIIRASSNRRPSQTSPFTLAYSTFLQPPPTEDQKERTSELFHLRFHLFFLSGRSASFLSSWLYTGCFTITAFIFNEVFSEKFEVYFGALESH